MFCVMRKYNLHHPMEVYVSQPLNSTVADSGTSDGCSVLCAVLLGIMFAGALFCAKLFFVALGLLIVAVACEARS